MRRFAGVAFTIAVLASCASAQTEPDELEYRITELNGVLSAQSARIADNIGSVDRPMRSVLVERASLLRRLMVVDPARIARLGLIREAAARIRSLGIPDSLEDEGEWTGNIDRLTADDFETRRSQRHILLRTGREDVELFLAEGARLPKAGVVRVRGIRLGDRVAALTVGEVPADESRDTSVGAVAAAEEVGAALTSLDCDTLGDQKTAVIMVTTPLSPAFPAGFDAAYFTQRYFGGTNASLATSSVNLFMQEASHGLTSLSGQVVGPFALGQNYTCDQYSSLLSAALTAANASVNFATYRRIVIVFPISTCTFSGLGTIGCSQRTTPDGSYRSSVSWIPILPTRNPQTILPVLAHEFGHNFGLSHAHTEDFGNVTLSRLGVTGVIDEYGDDFSVMGVSRSIGGQPVAGHFAASQESLMLDWLGPGSYLEVQAGGTFTVAPMGNASGLRALRILRDPATSSWLWLEYRQPIGTIDGSLSLLSSIGPSTVFQGALLHHEVPPDDDNASRLLDATPTATPNEFLNAALLPGATWSDTDSLLNVTANSANASGLSATVTYSAPCAVLQASATEFGPSGGTGTITVIAPASCNWTASSAANWITLTGATSGSGNGTVPFSVGSNGSSNQRDGFVTIQRQSIRFIQESAGLSALSVAPRRGSGLSGPFVFRLKHASGYQSINTAELYFENVYQPERPSCVVYYSGTLTSLRMFNDDSATLSGSLALASAGASISNGQCTLFATGSSIVGAGADLTITLQMSFSASYAGTHRIGARLTGAGGSDTGPQALGMWTVGGSCSYSLSAAAQTLTAAGGSGSLGVTTSAGCGWTAASNAAWLTVTGGSPGSGPGTVNYSVAANAGASARTGHLTIADQTLTVQQSACSATLAASGQSFATAGGTGTIQINSTPGCAWSVTGGAAWITFTSASSGTGSGSVSYTVALNPDIARSTVLSVGSGTYTIQQSGASAFVSQRGSLAQIVSAGTWKMTLNYLNLGGGTAQAQMDFTGNSGSPLVLPFTFPQQAGSSAVSTSSLTSTLNPGAQLIVESTGPDAQAVAEGWGQLVGPLGVTGFGIFGNPTQKWEAVVPLETRDSSRYVLPFDNTGTMATGVAVANLSNSAGNIVAIVRDPQGNVMGSSNILLGPLGHTSFMLTTSFPMTAGQRGTVEFQRPVGGKISALGLRANGPSLTTLPVLADVTSGGGSFTHVLYNGGFTNSFTLVNTSATASQVTLNFFGKTGSALTVPLLLPQSGQTITTSSLVQTIPGNGSLLIETVGQAGIPVVEGSARLVTTGNVSGFGIFKSISSGQEASVPLEDRNPASYVLAFDNTGGLATGIAVSDVANLPAGMGIVIRDDAGALMLSTTLNLPASGHTSFMLPEQYPVTTGKRGTVEFVTPSGGRISPLGLRATPAGNLTTIPVLAK